MANLEHRFGVMTSDPVPVRLLKGASTFSLLLVACSVLGELTGRPLLAAAFVGSIPIPPGESLVWCLAGFSAWCLATERSGRALFTGLLTWLGGLVLFALVHYEPWSSLSRVKSIFDGAAASPNGALGAASLGLTVALLASPRVAAFKIVLASSISVIGTAVGVLALWGHGARVAAAYRWGSGLPLAEGSSLILATLSAALYAVCLLRLTRMGASWGARGWSLGLGSTVFALLMAGSLLVQQQDEVTRELEKEAVVVRGFVESRTGGVIVQLERLGLQLAGKGNSATNTGIKEKWDREVAKIIERRPGIRSIELLNGKTGSVWRQSRNAGAESPDVVPGLTFARSRTEGQTVATLTEAGLLAVAHPIKVTDEIPAVVGLVIDAEEFFSTILPELSSLASIAVSFQERELVRAADDYPGMQSIVVAVKLFGAPGPRLEIRGNKEFIARNSSIHPLLVPALVMLAALLGTTLWWFASRASLSANLVRALEESITGVDEYRARAALAVEQCTEFVIMIQPDEKVLSINRSGLAVLGISTLRPDLFLGELYAPASLETFRLHAFVAARRGGWSGEAEMRGARGLPVFVNQKVLADYDDKGAVRAYVLIAKDIRTEATPTTNVKVGEAQIFEVLDGFPCAVWVGTSAGERIFVNDAFEQLTKLSRERLLSAEASFVPPTAQPERRKLLSNPQLPTSLRYTIYRGLDSREVVEHLIPRTGAEGAIIGVVGVIIDKTDENRLGASLASFEALCGAILKRTPVAVWIHDLTKRRVVTVSPAFSRIWHCPDEKLRENPSLWKKYIVRDGLGGRAVQVDEGAVSEPLELAYQIERDDGSHVAVDHYLVPIPTSTGEKAIAHIVNESVPLVKESERAPGVARQEVDFLYRFLYGELYDQVRKLREVSKSKKRSAEELSLAVDGGVTKLLRSVVEIAEVGRVRSKVVVREPVDVAALFQAGRQFAPPSLVLSCREPISVIADKALCEVMVRAAMLCASGLGCATLEVRAVTEGKASRIFLNFNDVAAMPESAERLLFPYTDGRLGLAIPRAVAERHDGYLEAEAKEKSITAVLFFAQGEG